MTTIFAIDAIGNCHETPFKRGSLDENRFYRVMLCSGSILDNYTKYFFKDENAYKNWSVNVRSKIDGIGVFPISGKWTTGWD